MGILIPIYKDQPGVIYKGWFRLLYSFGVIQPLWPTYNKPVFAGGYDMPPNGFKVVLAKLFMLCRGGL